jgi:regulator of replication initiation timing
MSTANSHVTFVESAPFAGDGFRLDREAGVVRGVAICGFKSRNGRDYPKAVLARDHKKYEGVSVNLNHFDGERQVTDYLGRLENVRIRPSDGKPIGDLKYVKNKPFTPEFEERVLEHPNSFGLSHVAVCSTKRVNGREAIESLNEVRSVDLVRDPATNSGIFESFTERDMADESALAAALAEASALKEQVKALTEENTSLKATNEALVKESADLKLNALIGDAKLSEVQREAVSLLGDDAKRKALVESFKAAATGEKPVSGERKVTDLRESAVPKTAADWKQRITA